MQILCCLFYPLGQFLGRACLILNTEGDLAVGVHIEKLCPWILKNRTNLCGNLVHGKITDFLTVYQHTAMKFPLIKLRDQSIDQACNRCFATPAAPTEQDTFSICNFQIDVMQAIMLLPIIRKGYIFKFNQPMTPPRTHNSKIRKATATAIIIQSAIPHFI